MAQMRPLGLSQMPLCTHLHHHLLPPKIRLLLRRHQMLSRLLLQTIFPRPLQ